MLRNLLYKLPSFSFKFKITTPPEDQYSVWQYVILGLLVFFGCYFGLSAYAILDMNEGLYAEVAREMFVNKHFIIPYLNDVPYLEKPPLFYWLLTLSYRLFGLNDFAARFVPSTITALTCLSFMYFGRKIQSYRVGWITALILLSSLIFIMIGRTVFFDMLLALCFTITLLSFYCWYYENEPKYLYISYLFLALAVLTKGFLAVVLIPLIMLIYMWLMKTEISRYYDLFNRKALILFLAVVVPWHFIAIAVQPGFTWEYFINNQILRFFNTRVPHDYHNGPIYFYVPRVIAYLLPWSILLPFLFPWPLKLPRPFDPIKTLMWIWFLVPFIFFSLSSDKGDYYMVIAAPPLAFLIAQKIDEWMKLNSTKFLFLAFTIVSAVSVAAGFIALLFYRSSRADFASAFSGTKIPYILTGPVSFFVLVLLIYGALGIYFCYRNPGKPTIPFLLLIGFIVPSLLFYLTVRERSQFMYSQVALAKFVQAQYEHRPIYLFEDFEKLSSLVYYNQEPSVIINSKSADLYFGSTTDQGKKQFITADAFNQLIKSQTVYVALRADKQAEFEALAGKDTFCTVQKNGNVLLLSNATDDCHASLSDEEGTQKAFNLDTIKPTVTEKQKS
jgi:4-amino-4-deoxy-L-arabinose transferase-like glycosyltransferase